METHLKEPVHYADTLLDQQHQQVEKVQVAWRRFRSKTRPRRGAVVAVIKGTDELTIGIQSKPEELKGRGSTQGLGSTSSGQFNQ